MANPTERTIKDPQGMRWRMREVPAKPGRFPHFLNVLVFESERGRFWTTIAADTLHRYAYRDLFDMLAQAKPIPKGKVIPEAPKPKPPAELEPWD
jgi:hypothetical protein